MASRSRSRSPLHHEFNLGIDQTSPTPSHTKAEDTAPDTHIIVPGDTYTKGIFIIRLENVPNDWKWNNVSVYVRNHTDRMDKAIANDITYIKVKTHPVSLYTRSFIHFRTEHLRDQALLLLKQSKEKVNGKIIFALKCEDWAPPHDSHTSNDGLDGTMANATTSYSTEAKFQKFMKGKYILRIDNLPVDWKWSDVFDYIKNRTDSVEKAIGENVGHILLRSGLNTDKGYPGQSCYIPFTTEYFMTQAYQLLKKNKNKKVHEVEAYNNPNEVALDNTDPNPLSHVSLSAITNDSKGLYFLKLVNVPLQWKCQDVSDYVKMHTDCVDKAIVEDIICYRINQGAILLKVYMCFKTEHYRDQALVLLKKTTVRIGGKRILAMISAVPRDRAHSPLLHEYSLSDDFVCPTTDDNSVKSKNINPKSKRYGAYHMRLENVPYDWKWFRVVNYVTRHTTCEKAIAQDIATTDLTTILMPNLQEYQMRTVHFRTEHYRDRAVELLNRLKKRDSGTRKQIIAYKVCKESPPPTLRTAAPKDMSCMTDCMTDEEDGTYGLSVDLLNDLKITLPLSRKVIVQLLPLDCEESSAYLVFSHAGTIASLTLQKTDSYSTAVVEYEHPVEAVQAVSMYNEQEIFGRKINCNMIKQETHIEGFSALGPGLGPNGTPLQDIRFTIEKKKLKADIVAKYNSALKYANELDSLTNRLIEANETTLALNTAQTKPNVTNPITPLSNFSANQGQPNMLLQNNQSTGTNAGSLETLLSNIARSNMDMQAQANKNQSEVTKPMQVGTDMQSPNVQVSTNHNNTNTQAGSNMQSAFNMQSGQDNTLKRPYMQSGPGNMQNNTQAGSNMQSAFNMQSGQGNTKKRPYMQSGPGNMQNNIQVGSNMQSSCNMQGGQNNTQKRPFNMLSGPANMQNNSNTLLSSVPCTFNQMATMQGGSEMQFGSQNPYNQSPYVQGSNNFGAVQTQQGVSNMQSVQQYADNTGSFGNKEPMSTVIQFKNLPPSLTQPALRTKMLEVGKVKFIQLGNGRALVHFDFAEDADQCIRLFNQTNLDGQLIEVRKI